MAAKRTRGDCISFRLTASERAQFDAKRHLSGLTMHEFLMELLRDKTIIVRPGAELVVMQLKRLGNKLDRISCGAAGAGKTGSCCDEIREVRDELARMLKKWQ